MRWEVPDGWQPGEALPTLRELRMHTIAFVTTFRPSAAVALAARSNPGVDVLVLAKSEHRQRAEQMGGRWADVDAHAPSVRAFENIYRQLAGGSPTYWRFCHTRWLTLASYLRANPLPTSGAIAMLDDDVLLFEQVEQRLRAVALVKPLAHVEAPINGAFVIASASAFQVNH